MWRQILLGHTALGSLGGNFLLPPTLKRTQGSGCLAVNELLCSSVAGAFGYGEAIKCLS